MDEHRVFADLLYQVDPVPMDPADILLFDSLVFHATGANSTDGTRPMVRFALHSVDELSSAEERTRVLFAGDRIHCGTLVAAQFE